MSVDLVNVHYFRRDKNYDDLTKTVELFQDNWQMVKLDNLDLIHQFIDWRADLPTGGLVKVAIQQNRVSVYTNQVSYFQSLLDKLDEYGDETSRLLIQYYQAAPLANYEKGVVYQTKPKHKFRIYLSSKRRTTEQSQEFNESLNRYEVYPSKSLQNWFTNPPNSTFAWSAPGCWTWEHYFFDFDDETLITLFLLSHEDWIGKVCRIEKR